MTNPHIEYVPRASLRPNPTNAHKHSAKQLKQIAASIKRFGFLVPIIIDDADMIAAGHGRWEASAQLDLEMVPVIRARFLTDADRRRFALADNRIAELSDWDEELLANELKILFSDGYDIEITGFTTADLDFSLDDSAKPKQAEAVELPDPDAPSVCQLGDLYHVGPHRLYCGNARAVESYEILLGGEVAAMVFADPPYNVAIDGHVSGLGRHRHREFAEASGEMTPPEFTAFLRAVFRNCVRFAADDAIHYHCLDWKHMRELLDAADGVYPKFKQLIVWKKSNAGMGTFYRSQHELDL